MKWFFTLFFTTSLVGVVDFHDFDVYQDQFTQKEIIHTIQTYLQNDASLSKFYSLSKDALIIKADNQIDYHLHLATSPQPKNISKKLPASLKGVKIALDPGHFGGNLGKIEARYIELKDQGIFFTEGELTYLTASLLKDLLEKEGAKVYMTRSQIGEGAHVEPFKEWLEKNSHFNRDTDALSTIFRSRYNNEDLSRRAMLINQFKPDLTIIIHYNTHLTVQERLANKQLTRSNYNLVFIPGGFCKNELNTREQRYEFLRLIVTDHLKHSLRLSRCILQQFIKYLPHTSLPDEETNQSLKRFCLQQESGIFSRNLALTRRVHSPLCYGETLIQNNEHEIYILNSEERHKRLMQVAKAYLEGIKQFLETIN